MTAPGRAGRSPGALAGGGLAAILIAVFVVRALSAAAHFSPTYDETAHLPAGVSYLATGDYRLNPEHPPLAKQIAALPLILTDGAPDVTAPPLAGPWRAGEQWTFGIAYLYGRNRDAQKLLMTGRAGAVALSALLAVVVYLWASRLWGVAGGLLSLGLYTLCPTVLAHAPIVHTDVPLALAAVAAVWCLWRFGENPSGLAGAYAIAGAGLAIKFTGLALLGVMIALTAVADRARPPGQRILRSVIGPVVSLAVLAGCYGVVSLPRYVEGLSMLLAHSGAGHEAYFLGEVSREPWLAYFPVALLVKTPVATLALLLAAVAVPPRWTGGAPRAFPGLVWIALPAGVFLLLPVAGGLNLGVRYLLPALPFLFVLAGRLVRWTGPARPVAVGVVALLVVWLVATGLAAHPEYLAYFNEPAGGTGGGAHLLADSNLDWGQDLLRLARWYRSENLSGIYLSWFGSAPPGAYGIRYRWLPGKGASSPLPGPVEVPPDRERLVISLHCLLGVPFDGADPYAWLRERSAVTTIGTTLAVYDLTGDAEAHRRLAAVYETFGRPAEAAAETAIAERIDASATPGGGER